MAFGQTAGKETEETGMLFEEFCRLETNMRNLQKSENEMLNPKVTSEHSTWHSNCPQAPRNIFEQWTNSNPDIKWVSRRLVSNLQNRGFCLTCFRLEEILSHSCDKKTNWVLK